MAGEQGDMYSKEIRYDGAKEMSITGRMGNQRERMLGMTDEERAWRVRYLKSLELQNEPITPPNYYKEMYNPIRRFYKAPLNVAESAITPVVGEFAAGVIRRLTGKFIMGVIGLYLGAYYIKYNSANWERAGSWMVFKSRSVVYPGDPGFPNFNPRTQGKDFFTQGSEKSDFYKNHKVE